MDGYPTNVETIVERGYIHKVDILISGITVTPRHCHQHQEASQVLGLHMAF